MTKEHSGFDYSGTAVQTHEISGLTVSVSYLVTQHKPRKDKWTRVMLDVQRNGRSISVRSTFSKHFPENSILLVPGQRSGGGKNIRNTNSVWGQFQGIGGCSRSLGILSRQDLG